MTRTEYEAFHGEAGKVIPDDIAFAPRKQHGSILMAGPIKIHSKLVPDARLEIHFNRHTLAKIFCICSEVAGGPICRLCVDGLSHHPCGRSHKHRLNAPRCPKDNLKVIVEDRPDLSGKSMRDLFAEFCSITSITHTGSFIPPPGV